VAGEDNVVDSQMADGVLDDGARAEIAGVQDIGNIPMDEDITRLQAENKSLGASRIRATDPENLGVLAIRKRGEQLRVFLGSFGSPFLILLQRRGESVWRVISPGLRPDMAVA
jgi:hypothetical protein